MSSRREYVIDIIVNGRRITKVVIDPHYEIKHSGSVTDEIVLNLVRTLDGRKFVPEEIKHPFSYYSTDRIQFAGKYYKLIWLLEDHQIYIGVVNAYRR